MAKTHSDSTCTPGSQPEVDGAQSASTDRKPFLRPLKVGRFTLQHRIVMAPLTRQRADRGGVQPKIAEIYYSQRATRGGLIISEATNISDEAVGYAYTPGIYTDAQIRGWRPVTEAVHRKGGLFFCQLWHTGRASHSSFQRNNVQPVAPSAIAVSAQFPARTYDGEQLREVPRALEHSEIKRIVKEYAKAATNALEAGFDGVEIHAANGYLIHQFLSSSSNCRRDEYGGSIQNRCRFLMEVAEAVVAAVGADRVGVRLSPSTTFLDAYDDRPHELYLHVLARLQELSVAYVHIIEPRVNGSVVEESSSCGENEVDCKFLRRVAQFKGVMLSAGGHSSDSALRLLRENGADAVVFGRLFISNPDLVHRLAKDHALSDYDRGTFFTQTSEGYIDYPFHPLNSAASDEDLDVGGLGPR